jgi:tetratricopeptide (TPR) repeat protein
MHVYTQLIKSHYYLKSLPEPEASYRPYCDLGLKLKEVVVDFIQNNDDLIKKSKLKLSGKIEDYIFLEEDQTVDPNKMDYLIYFIQHVYGKKFKYSNNTLRDFWIRARVYSLKMENPTISNHTNIRLLNVIGEVCGFGSFSDFLQKHYRHQTSNLKILILPFPGNIKNASSVELMLNKRLDMLAETGKLPISVVFKYMSSKWASKRYFTPSKARKEGKIEGADLVIFGDILSLPQEKPRIALQYVLVEPIHGLEGDHKMEVSNLYKYLDLMTGSIPNALDAFIFCCLGIRDFLAGNHEKAIAYFLQIPTDSAHEKEGIYFRIGTIYDLMDKNKLAIHYYALALEAGGIISTKEELLNWTRDGDLLVGDEMMESDNFKNKTIKMLIFEIAKIQHALLLNSSGNQDRAKKYLEQAVKYMNKCWLDTEYRELIAKAYFSLALLYSQPDKKERKGLPEKVISYYLSAIKLGKEVSIHRSAADYLHQYNYLEKALKVVREHHGEDAELMGYYYEKLNDKI